MNTKLPRKVTLRQIGGANYFDGAPIKFGILSRLSRLGLVLILTVFCIFCLCSEVQMKRVNTQPAITCRAIVKNVETYGNGTKSQNPSGSMRADFNFGATPVAYTPITGGVNTASPKPTSVVSDPNFGPKAAMEGLRNALRSQIGRGNLDHLIVNAPFGLLARRSVFIISTSGKGFKWL